jgi:hypothetical protein
MKSIAKDMKDMFKGSPDPNDPFAPDLSSSEPVCCSVCRETYAEKEIRWDAEATLWVCKYWPECRGSGLGFAIFHHNGPACPVHPKH